MTDKHSKTQVLVLGGGPGGYPAAFLAADLGMATFKITNLGQGVANSDAVNFGQVFNSPIFTGVPEAPTAASGTNTEQIATTAFVISTAFAGVTQSPTPPFILQSLGVI